MIQNAEQTDRKVLRRKHIAIWAAARDPGQTFEDLRGVEFPK